MGTVFKVALLVPDGDGLPPGFAPDDITSGAGHNTAGQVEDR
jgi:hypothetical protein